MTLSLRSLQPLRRDPSLYLETLTIITSMGQMMDCCPCFPFFKSRAGEKPSSLCAICHKCPQNSVLTNCFHQYCCQCFLGEWVDSGMKVVCRTCHTEVYRILRCFGNIGFGTTGRGNRLELAQLNPDDDRNYLIAQVNSYNTKFAPKPQNETVTTTAVPLRTNSSPHHTRQDSIKSNKNY